MKTNTSLTSKNNNSAVLEARFILLTALAAGWQIDAQGFTYPIFDLSGRVLTVRFKGKPGATPKYRWPSGKPDGATFYTPFPDKLKAGIAAAHGVLYIVNGEPAVLAMVAAGIENALSWFGEGSVPANLAAELNALGVNRALYIADNDEPGTQAAIKTRDVLAGSGIDFEAFSLAGSVAHKGDVNDLLIAVQGHAGAFRAKLESLPVLNLPARVVTPARVEPQAYTLTDDDLAPLKRAVFQRLEERGFKRRGEWLTGRAPHREDQRPSFSVNALSGAWNDFTGTTGNLFELAEMLGLAPRDYLPKRPISKTAKRRKATTPAGEAVAVAPVLHIEQLNLEQFTPDVVIDAPFLTPALIPAGDVIIKSDTGTGKSTTIAQLTKGKKVLFISHRTALCATLAAVTDSENYEGLEAVDLRRLNRLTITYDSLPKLIAPDAPLPAYDVVVLDEIEQGLAHLGGGTLNGKKDRAEVVYSVLKQLLASAGRVIGLDAHASRVSVDWLRALRGQVTALENTHARKRSTLTVFEKKPALIDAVTSIVAENAGPVAIACSSIEDTKRIERHFAELLSPDDVFSVHGENSTDSDRQRFIRHINEELPRYRVFVYSPSVGSGVDIQAPVRLNVGIFNSEPLNAAECHQMLNRCRNAQETFVYVQYIEGSRETDAQTIFHDALKSAISTGKVSGFDREGIPVATDTQKALHRLLSLIDAYGNASKNALRDHFMSLAVGYAGIRYREGNAAETAERLKEIAETIAAEVKARVLAVAPVTYAAYEAAQADGKLTMDVRYGYTRHKIEQAAGQEIDGNRYDLLHDESDRARLYLLSNVLHAPLDELKTRDRHQAKKLISKRRHDTRKVIVARQFILNVWGSAGLNAEMMFTVADVRENVALFQAAHGEELRLLFGRRADLSSEPIPVIRWFLGQLGLKLTAKQMMKDGERFMLYSLDAETWDTMRGLASTCHARQVADAIEREASREASTKAITKNVDERYSSPPERSNSIPSRPAKPAVSPMMPPPLPPNAAQIVF